MTDKLKDKKIDIIAYTAITAGMLILAISFFADAKKDPEDRSMKFLTALSTLGTCIAGGQLGVDIKKYNDIKKELAKRATEKQK
ncbi:MAG: hypothetical protein J6W41_01070 [Alphaproteobacteria bacterium]|nr:hypothetical protein [Alphaproteobacteria bacterium]